MWSQWFPTLLQLSVRNWGQATACWLLTASAWLAWTITCKYEITHSSQCDLSSVSRCVYRPLSLFSPQWQRTDPIIRRLAQTAGGQDGLKDEQQELGYDQMLKDEPCWKIECNRENRRTFGFILPVTSKVSIFILPTDSPDQRKTHSLLGLHLESSSFLCKELWDNEPEQQDWIMMLFSSDWAFSGRQDKFLKAHFAVTASFWTINKLCVSLCSSYT